MILSISCEIFEATARALRSYRRLPMQALMRILETIEQIIQPNADQSMPGHDGTLALAILLLERRLRPIRFGRLGKICAAS
jgi:hypothetical protein